MEEAKNGKYALGGERGHGTSQVRSYAQLQFRSCPPSSREKAVTVEVKKTNSHTNRITSREASQVLMT